MAELITEELPRVKFRTSRLAVHCGAAAAAAAATAAATSV
jgi:hypothetical protein